MKARKGSRRFSDSKKRLAPGEVLRKMSWRRVVCEKLSRRLQEFGKKLLGVQRVNTEILQALKFVNLVFYEIRKIEYSKFSTVQNLKI